jgi:membrane protein YdbS with pleckstrin-like domain
MKCQVCSAEVATGALFCQQCGTKMPLMEDADSPAANMDVEGREEASDEHDPRAALGRRRGRPDSPEEMLWEGGYSPKAMAGALALAALVTIVLIAAGVYFDHWLTPLALLVAVWLLAAGIYAVRRLGIHYRLTNHMFYHQRGVLTRRTDRIEAIDINDVTYEQGLLGRMLGYGRVKISSSDKTDPVFWLEGIENVQEVARMIDKARRAERLRRGVSVEAI